MDALSKSQNPWHSDHEQVKVWLPRELAFRFREACKASGKQQSDVLRDAIVAMLPEPAQPAHNGQQGGDEGKGA